MPIATDGNLDIANMEAISGPGDAVQSSVYHPAQELADLALVICEGTIAPRNIIDADGDTGTT